MTTPIINGQAFAPSTQGFADHADLTVTLGTNAGRWIRVMAIAFDAFNTGLATGYITGAVLDPGGANIALTLESDDNLNGSTPSYAIGINGRICFFRLDSIDTPGMPTGTVTLRVSLADANNKPLVHAVWGDSLGVAGAAGSHSSGTGVSWASAAMTATTNDLVVGVGLFDCGATPSGPATVTGAGGTAVVGVGGQFNFRESFIASKSAANPTLQATIANNSFTPAWFSRAWVMQGIAAAPVISAEPIDATVSAPSIAGFSATISGTYSGLRWQRQAAGVGAWVDVSGGTGGTSVSFTTGATALSGGSFNNTDKFRLAVDWAGGTVYSAEVTLTVLAAGTAPSFTIQPSDQSSVVGNTATFSFRVSGSGSLTIQAKKNGTNVGSPFAVTAGVTADYTTPSLLIGDTGAVYTFEATGDTSPPATSTGATLTVLQPLATTFSFSLNGGNSLTGLKYAVFDQVSPDLWTAPVKKAANGSSNGSGLITIDVTGLTTRRIGELGSAFVTNSDGTATGGAQAATRKASYYVGVFA